jgi:hypothetical protein
MASLSAVLQERVADRIRSRRRCELAKQEAITAAHVCALAAELNAKGVVEQALRNQGELERQSRALAFEAERFAKQTARWMHAHRELSSAMEQLIGIEELASNVEASLQRCTENLEQLCSAEQTFQTE